MRPIVLFVVTSTAELGATGARTGVWLEELAAPYAAFTTAGFEIRIASTAGGEGPIDPASLEKPWLTLDGERFLASPVAVAALSATLPIDRVCPEDISAAFVVGGTGTLWDFPRSTGLASLIERMVARECPVALICHGVSALIGAHAADGTPLARGRPLTCFSNEEERMLGFDQIVPLLAETELVKQGAIYSSAAPFEPHVVTSGMLLTGQNPASAGPLAEAVAAALAMS